jgi:ribosome-associated heat shock protein Hsp15
VTAADKDNQRLDKWLWHARFFKTRTIASEFCESTGVRVAGQPVRKAHYHVKVGDVLTFTHGSNVRVLRILALSPRRLSPPLARELYDDLAPPPSREASAGDRQPVAKAGAREPGSGRPTKADRRALQRLKTID